VASGESRDENSRGEIVVAKTALSEEVRHFRRGSSLPRAICGAARDKTGKESKKMTLAEQVADMDDASAQATGDFYDWLEARNILLQWLIDSVLKNRDTFLA
jgi:hypothetical protein